VSGELARKEKTVPRRTDVPHWWPIIEDRFDRLGEDFREERDRAEKHRQIMVDGLSLLERTVAALNTTVGALTARVDKVEPVAENYRDWRAEGRGASKARRRIITIGLPLLAIAATIVAAVIGALLR
jgi:hypothetical protein